MSVYQIRKFLMKTNYASNSTWSIVLHLQVNGLTDSDGVPLIGKKVSIMIDGTNYEREVTSKGYAALS